MRQISASFPQPSWAWTVLKSFTSNHKHFFSKSHFRVVGFWQPRHDQHHHDEGKMVNCNLRSHHGLWFKTLKGSSMPLDFFSQLSVSWNEMNWIRRLNHSIVESLWLEKTFQVIEIIRNIAVKFDIIYNSSGLPEDSHKGPLWSPCTLIFSV